MPNVDGSGDDERRPSPGYLGAPNRRTVLRAATVAGVSALTSGVVGGVGSTTALSDCTTISSPGTYELTRSITPSSTSGRGCIEIEADDVTLDGAGHALDGRNLPSSENARAVHVASLRQNVTIRNLAVRNWSTGLYFDAESGRIEDVTVGDTDTGIYLWNASMNQVVDTSVERSGRGVQLSADGSVTETQSNAFDHVTVAGNDIGIHFGSFTTGGNEVTNSCIRDNRIGVETAVRSYGTRLRDNTIAGNVEYGVLNRDLTETEAEESYPDEDVQGSDVVEAAGNYWGSACGGPGSPDDPDAPFADPVTGRLADGGGDAVSEGTTGGDSNVHFDPFLTVPIEGVGHRS